MQYVGLKMKFQEFSIKELESFSGVKAHTIRIWEQRYGLLAPERSDTNIRKYTDKDLKLLLNVSLLNNLGYKISKIAGLSEQEMQEIIVKHTRPDHTGHQLMHLLKMAMLNYDEPLFNSVVEPYMQENGLERTYGELFIPFLKQIGYLWQAGAICPAQEHFISGLVRQKMFSAVNALPPVAISESTRTFVLFLPELEIHELSLIVLYYSLKKEGHRVIFLGQSVPLEDLIQVYQRLGNVEFVSIFTTHPPALLVTDYLKKISKEFDGTECLFHLTGNILTGVKSPDFNLINIYPGAEALLHELKLAKTA